ncbi:MAG: hypothetical protein IJR63_05235 [Synergistaceae bacterium]|nr:hypothetical protein [Synergistaceae bacterium]
MLKKISDAGYSGLIDIELFKAGDKIYLCEINWRDSARVFMCKGTKVYYPLIWYYSVTGQDDKIHGLPLTTKDTSQYGMCEQVDIRHVFHSEPGFPRINLREWLGDVRKAQSFAYWHNDDKLPALWSYPKDFVSAILPHSMKDFIKRIIGRK